VKNKFYVMPPDNLTKEENLFFRVLYIGLDSITDKMNYSGDIVTKGPNLTEEQLNEVINNINKTYFDFEEFITNKLNVRIKNPLDENLSEDYPTSFNIEHFKTLKSFNQRIQYCKEHLTRISSGSSRIVYKIDDQKVLKLAYNKKGISQNLAEIDFGTEIYLEGIVANIFNYEENGLWVEMELATKITPDTFKQITGFEFNDFAAAINNYYHERTNYRNGRKMEVNPEIVAQMWEDDFVYGIFQYVGNYDIPAGDLTRLSTYGAVKRDNQDTIVIIDYGLTDDVYKTHYKN